MSLHTAKHSEGEDVSARCTSGRWAPSLAEAAATRGSWKMQWSYMGFPDRGYKCAFMGTALEHQTCTYLITYENATNHAKFCFMGTKPVLKLNISALNNEQGTLVLFPHFQDAQLLLPKQPCPLAVLLYFSLWYSVHAALQKNSSLCPWGFGSSHAFICSIFF